MSYEIIFYSYELIVCFFNDFLDFLSFESSFLSLIPSVLTESPGELSLTLPLGSSTFIDYFDYRESTTFLS